MVRELAATATRPGVLLSIGTAASLTFAALALIAARQGVFAVDHTTHAFVGLVRHGSLQGSMGTVSLLGQSGGLIPLIALASLVLWRHSRRWAIGLPIVMAGTGVVQFLAKWAVDRPRPNGAEWGFPSGHTLSVVVFFGILAYLVCTSDTRRGWRCTGAAVSAATVLAVAFSRLYLDVHWLSDVGGGLAVGLAYLPLAIWCVERVSPRAGDRDCRR